MDNFLSHAQLMDLLRYAKAKSLSMLSFTFIPSLLCFIDGRVDPIYFYITHQVWDHISGKLKKDLQYQADVSYTFISFKF